MTSRALILSFVLACAPGAIAPAATASAPAGTPANAAPKLGAVLLAFTPDAAAPSRNLPWTAGAGLPVKWDGPAGPAPEYLKAQGMTRQRTGSLRVTLDTPAPAKVQVILQGDANGIRKVSLGFAYDGNQGPEVEPMGRIDRALAADGIKLGALKCRKEGEGVTGGNVAYLLPLAGRKPAAVIEFWSCGADGTCMLDVTLADPKGDLSDVECHG